MLSLPDELLRQFNTVLDKVQYPENIKHFYRKWLRYYWDFCNKYHHDPFHRSSLPLFLKKLEQKRQPDQQRQQAHQAILLFYQTKARTNADSVSLKTESRQPFSRQPLPIPDLATPITAANTDASINHSSHREIPHQNPKQVFPSENAQYKIDPKNPTGCSWVSVFDGLTREIKLRHYSPKTLKSYLGWARRLQAFTKSKDYMTLTQQDVVDFLSDLAVEKKVSASSQNQAFNALLFLFKQVLKKYFGEIKGVTRAKRKQYIPIVLSREEIELIFDHFEWSN